MENKNKLRVHYIQHIDFEGLGVMKSHLENKGVELTGTKVFENQLLPSIEIIETIDLLIILGGPMGVNDVDKYPWLTSEKAFVKAFIEAKKPVLGICLGAQLIADVLGASVYPGEHKEIGWFNITSHKRAEETPLSGLFEHEQMAFHWHGDTFDLPEGAVPLISSEAYINQGFVYPDKVVALQCHMEMSEAAIVKMLMKDDEELAIGPYVQDAETMIRQSYHCELNGEVIKEILNWMLS
jgi:GMP synthase-like glutamine amidotransferase